MRMVDIERWMVAGTALIELDPKRLLTLLEIAESLVRIYHGEAAVDGLGGVGYLLAPPEDGGKFQ